LTIARRHDENCEAGELTDGLARTWSARSADIGTAVDACYVRGFVLSIALRATQCMDRLHFASEGALAEVADMYPAC